jgi:tRNA A37 threonylcarbamoyladenosine modification protein TsaB
MIKVNKQFKKFLYIDGVSSRDLVLALVADKKVTNKKIVKNGTRTEKLVNAIFNYLAGASINGIIVAQGAGSFSQVRIICVVANALAYAQQIKLTTVPVNTNLEQVSQRLSRLKWSKLILPKYNGPGVGQ